jgi:hypothetical protein
MDGEGRNHIAAIGEDGHVVSTWHPEADDTVRALSVKTTTDTLFVGGSFTSVETQTRNHLAAIGTDGTLMSWSPDVGGGTASGLFTAIHALTFIDTLVFAGGDFTTMDGEVAGRIALMNPTGGRLP